MASRMVCGPVVSPACGTEASPSARARANTSANCGRGTPISGPPRPNPTLPAGANRSSQSIVRSPDSSPSSPGMSYTHTSETACSSRARVRALVSASATPSGSIPIRRWESGVTVSSA